MAFCKSCGQDIGTAAFCPKCGANQTASTAPVPAGAPVGVATESLQENVAGLLCYAGGWVTGIIFLLIDKRPWVKFQAAQSIVVFGGLHILMIGMFFMGGTFGGLLGWSMMGVLHWLIRLASFILWILLMVKAYQHETFRVPVAADIADGIAK